MDLCFHSALFPACRWVHSQKTPVCASYVFLLIPKEWAHRTYCAKHQNQKSEPGEEGHSCLQTLRSAWLQIGLLLSVLVVLLPQVKLGRGRTRHRGEGMKETTCWTVSEGRRLQIHLQVGHVCVGFPEMAAAWIKAPVSLLRNPQLKLASSFCSSFLFNIPPHTSLACCWNSLALLSYF
jgi:hypothetical protein